MIRVSPLVLGVAALCACVPIQQRSPPPPSDFSDTALSAGPLLEVDAGRIYLEFGPCPERVMTLTVNIPQNLLPRYDQHGPLVIDRADAGDCRYFPRSGAFSQTFEVPRDARVYYEISEFSRGDGGMYLEYSEGYLDTSRLGPGCHRLAIDDTASGLQMVVP